MVPLLLAPFVSQQIIHSRVSPGMVRLWTISADMSGLPVSPTVVFCYSTYGSSVFTGKLVNFETFLFGQPPSVSPTTSY